MKDVLSSLLGDSSELFQQRNQRRQELARDIFAASYLAEKYTAADGRRSDYLFRPELFMTKPTVLRRLVNVLAAEVPSGVDRLVGTEPGSLPIAAALSLETGLPFVALRENDDAATGFSVRGELHAGERLVVIEDVTATGSRAVAAAQAVQAVGAELDSVICIVDREEGAVEKLKSAGLEFNPLYAVSELLADPAGPAGTTGSAHRGGVKR